MTTSTQDPGSPLQRKKRRGRAWLLVSLAAALILGGAGVLYYRNHGSTQEDPAGTNGRARGQNPPQPVSVGEVAVKDVPIWLTGIGSAIPRNLVTIRTRVDGELFRVHFTEGQTVKAGQLLAEIDPRPFQAQLDQAKGQLARDEAQLQNARVDLERYKELWAKDSIPKQQLDTQEALVRQYQGTVENDRGVVENARLQLEYTRITAPVTGRIGLRQVDPGNQVHAADTNGLAALAQMQPMTVVFAVAEGYLPDINQRLAGGDAPPVEAWDREQKHRLATGRLLTTDNQIDSTTGTIKLKAEFANGDERLFPNQFVNVRLLLGTRKNSTVVPGAAIQRGSRGAFVYTVDGEGMVKAVAVTPGPVDGELVAVDGPLKPGERVVTDGADKLRDGAKVSVITPEQRQAPGSDGASPAGGHRRQGGGGGNPARPQGAP